MTSSRKIITKTSLNSLTDIEQELEGSYRVKRKIISFWQMANKGLVINNITITYSML